MKLGAVSDPKEVPCSTAMLDTERERRSPVLWLGLVMFLTVCVVVAGFLGAFYMFKQTAERSYQYPSPSEDNPDENINYNVYQKNTVNEEEEQPEQKIYYDTEKDLTVLVNEGEDVCLLIPSNPENLEAELLKSYRSQHPDPDGKNDKGVELKPHEEEVKDKSLLGPTISAMCQDKPVFWLFPKQGEEGEPDEQTQEGKGMLSRRKRSGYYYRRHYYRPYYYRRHYGYYHYGYYRRHYYRRHYYRYGYYRHGYYG